MCGFCVRQYFILNVGWCRPISPPSLSSSSSSSYSSLDVQRAVHTCTLFGISAAPNTRASTLPRLPPFSQSMGGMEVEKWGIYMGSNLTKPSHSFNQWHVVGGGRPRLYASPPVKMGAIQCRTLLGLCKSHDRTLRFAPPLPP